MTRCELRAAESAVSLLRDVETPTLLFTSANVIRGGRVDGSPEIVFRWYPALVHPGCYFTCADDCHNGIYATRTAYERSGPYDSEFQIAGDFSWIMACLDASAEFVYTSELTINYVMGGLSSDPRKHGEECLLTMQRRFPMSTSEDIGGLHHTLFFVPPDGSVPGRPGDRQEFFRSCSFVTPRTTSCWRRSHGRWSIAVRVTNHG